MAGRNLGDMSVEPGESRHLGYVFLSGQKAVAYLSATEKFYVWKAGSSAMQR